MVFALKYCPALIRATRDQDLATYQVQRRYVTMISSAGWVEGPLEAESKRVQPAMWVKLVVRGLAVR